MPYSDEPPTLVFPDTREGRHDRHMRLRLSDEGVTAALCSLYEPERNPLPNEHAHGYKQWCRNREQMGDRAHNWCFRCPAGFMLWRTENDAAEHRRMSV